MANIVGTQGADVLTGTSGNDVITGLAGNDQINGGGGADQIDGGEGDDSIALLLGSGTSATGGIGRDTFTPAGNVFSGNNLIIADFVAGGFGDYLDLRGLFNNPNGGDPFAAGYIHLEQVGNDTVVQIDADGLNSGRYSYSPVSVLTLFGVQSGQITSANLFGFDPNLDASRSITGTENADTLTGGAGNNIIRGLGGDDIINGLAGNDTLEGGAGNDTIEGGTGYDVVDGGDGNDILSDSAGGGTAFGGTDTLRGGAGNDIITVSRTFGMDKVIVDAGSGRDTVQVRGPQMTVDLGADDDTLRLYYYNSGSVTATLGTGRDEVLIDASYEGGSGYYGGVVGDIADFTPGDGGDILSLRGLIRANPFWDGRNPFASGQIQLQQSGVDTVVVFDADGAGTYSSGSQLLVLRNVQATQLTAANFDGYSPDGSAVPGVISTGTNNADTIVGGEGADTIYGLAGADIIVGDAGNDLLDGGAGDDNIEGGLGSDHILGGAGNDVLTDTQGGSDTIDGGDGNDTIELVHTNYNGPEQVTIGGGAGDDTVRIKSTSAGTVSIDLGEGADTLFLEQIAYPATTVNVVLGGGADRVVLTGNSPNNLTIADFKAGAGGDVIDISALVSSVTPGMGYVRLVQAAENVLVQVDADGSSGPQAFVTRALLQNTQAAQINVGNLAGFAPTVVSMADLATVRVTTPAIVTEGVGNSFTPLLTLRNVTTATTNVTVSFVAEASTATNGTDFAGANFSGTVSVSQSVAGDFVFALPMISYYDDLAVEGAETIAFRVTASGQTFANGTDTTLVTVRLAERAQTGGAGDDRLSGTRFDDVLRGNDGNDTVLSSAGSDIIMGGAGRNAVLYGDVFRHYSVDNSHGSLTVNKTDGVDTIAEVQDIAFTDGHYVIDADSVGAQVARLYDTVLQRGADPAGLDYWLDQIQDNGATLNTVATSFLVSSEFQVATGTLSNAAFVDYLYQHALGRGADAGGGSYWTSQLDNGLSRSSMLVSFSETGEHRTLTADMVGKGYFDTDDTYQAVALLYDSFTGRLPDTGGLTFWSEQVKTGARTLTQVANEFAASGEFTNAIAGKNNEQLVDFMYQNTLDRGPDASGRAFWVNQLDAGLSKGALLLSFSLSAEHYGLKAADIIGGIQVAGGASANAATATIQPDGLLDNPSLASVAPASAFISEHAAAASHDVDQVMWLDVSHYAGASTPTYVDMGHSL